MFGVHRANVYIPKYLHFACTCCLADPYATILRLQSISNIFKTPLQCSNCRQFTTWAKNILVILRRNCIHQAWGTFHLVDPAGFWFQGGEEDGVKAVINLCVHVCMWTCVYDCVWCVCVVGLMLAVSLWMIPIWDPNWCCQSNPDRNNPEIVKTWHQTNFTH